MRRNLITVPEAAPILGISVERTYTLAREGILPVVRLGRQIRLDPVQLDNWIARGGKALPGGWKHELNC
ncbi:helix-turn-helix domain-containing protein [Neobacillus cucumis]|uniref:helix-turn-helix domain-containing protein n=1 Tax=Neobacillus cucumis TaxID=1740721 RepID=UPI002041ABED|nr:helix-turn-helix domain-containing protein [Neobacillus cucumis]MCM3724585.1 helix-turn-helix domain-containing protein [Neobacillus cucumis]